MVQKRPKHRRRVLDSSDAEESEHRIASALPNKVRDTVESNGTKKASVPSKTSSKRTTLSLQQLTTVPPPSSSQSTPEKPKQTANKTNGTRAIESKETYSFFNAATQRQQLSYRTVEKNINSDHEVDDLIEDDQFLHARIEDPMSSNANGHPTQVYKKRSWDVANGITSNSIQARRSQKLFKTFSAVNDKPLARSQNTVTPVRPWTEEYPPTSVDQLAVHKNKIADVKRWLEGISQGTVYQRLLVLKGAAGTGKTATLSLLAKHLNYAISEWKAPSTSEYGTQGYIPLYAQFDDFLGRAGKYNGLELVAQSPAEGCDNVDQNESSDVSSSRRQLVFVEEFPDTSGSSSNALQSFQSTILGYLDANSTKRMSVSGKSTVPLVLIVSETTLPNGNSSDDMTARRLLGPEIMHHPATAVIEFNATAPTFISKALKLVLEKHAKQTGRHYNHGQNILKRLTEIGDTRNAVAALELVCTQMEHDQSASMPATAASQKKKVKNSARIKSESINKHEEAILASLSLRESSLGLFHAVGKVVYNKRNDDPASHEANVPPSATTVADLSQRSRPPLDLDLDMLLNSTGTDTSTFLSALHENYMPSCLSANRDLGATLSSIVSCLDALTDGDILGNFSTSHFNSRTTTEGLRQDELAFQSTVRGIMHALPHPVKRESISAPSSAKRNNKRDAQKMFFPTSLKLWRRREEMQSLLDLFVKQAADGRIAITLPPKEGSRNKTPREIDQPGRTPSLAPRPQTKAINDDTLSVQSAVSRSDLLLERLPYLNYIIPQSAHDPFATNLFKELEQVSRFRGIGAIAEEDEDDVETSLAFSRNGVIASKMSDAAKNSTDLGVENLALSEDDIEDG